MNVEVLLHKHVVAAQIAHQALAQLAREHARRLELRFRRRHLGGAQHAVARVEGESHLGPVPVPQVRHGRLADARALAAAVVDEREHAHVRGVRVVQRDHLLAAHAARPEVGVELGHVHPHVEARQEVHHAGDLVTLSSHVREHGRADAQPKRERDPEEPAPGGEHERVLQGVAEPRVPHHGPLPRAPVDDAETQRPGEDELHHVARAGGVVELHLLGRRLEQVLGVPVHLLAQRALDVRDLLGQELYLVPRRRDPLLAVADAPAQARLHLGDLQDVEQTLAGFGAGQALGRNGVLLDARLEVAHDLLQHDAVLVDVRQRVPDVVHVRRVLVVHRDESPLLVGVLGD